MAIKFIRPRTIEGVFKHIEKLTFADDSNHLVFRGHSDSRWRLQSTLTRFARGGGTELSIRNMDETLNHFFARLASAGKMPVHEMSRRTKLEYGRHYGLPSPLIDFSHSPYIALWMAMNGVRPRQEGSAAIYALDLSGLGILWQKFSSNSDAFDEFRWSERHELFKESYPVNTLQFIEFPTSWNTRMLRQLGVFLYDSLQYGHGVEFTDLEDFIEKGIDPKDPDGAETFTLHKILVRYRDAPKVFRRLELMGIDGTRLYDNHEGAVADVINSSVFNRVAGFAHDID